jgi:hypothetical protein
MGGGANGVVHQMGVTTGTTGVMLLEQGVSVVFSSYGSTHHPTHKEMGISNTINRGYARHATIVADHHVIVFLKLQVVEVDGTLQLRVYLDSTTKTVLMVTLEEVTHGHLALALPQRMEHSLLKVKVGINVVGIPLVVEAGLTLVVRAQAREVTGIPYVNEDIGLDVSDQPSQPVSSLVVVVWGSVLVRDHKVTFSHLVSFMVSHLRVVVKSFLLR